MEDLTDAFGGVVGEDFDYGVCVVAVTGSAEANPGAVAAGVDSEAIFCGGGGVAVVFAKFCHIGTCRLVE